MSSTIKERIMIYIEENSILSSVEMETWAINYAGLSAETVRRDARKLVEDNKIDALIKKGSKLAWYKSKKAYLPFGFFIREKNKPDQEQDSKFFTKQESFL